MSINKKGLKEGGGVLQTQLLLEDVDIPMPLLGPVLSLYNCSPTRAAPGPQISLIINEQIQAVSERGGGVGRDNALLRGPVPVQITL